MDRIEADLREARGIFARAERIFLVNGDALVLQAKKLKAIAARIKKIFPECRTISMYASIGNIQTKSDQDLTELKKAGINDLYVGVESGWDQVLAHINKGHTVAQAQHQLNRLNQTGIKHIANLMLGVAGKGNGVRNAGLTAAFLNRTRPDLIWVGTLGIFEGTELHREMVNGSFVPASELEILEEEKTLINEINLPKVPLYGVHPTNTVRLAGNLPDDRQKMIATIDNAVQRYGKEALATTFARTSL
jgi:radical SAM superfamily enzyme YgiQ (UPF0313 family)